MAVTRKADISVAVPQLWSAQLLAQAEDMTFWHQFEGPEGSNMPVIRKDELTTQPGDTIKVDLVMAITGAGQTAEATLLDGNEQKLSIRQGSFSPALLKNAVRWSKLSTIQMTHNMRQTALAQLRKWLAGILDNNVFAELTGTGVGTMPSSGLWFAGTATSVNTVTDTDAAGRLKLNDISEIKAFAKSTQRIEPLRGENGEEVYGLVVHPYAALALKKDANYQQAQRDAQVRGATNPLFTGAIATWDGVIIYESNRTPVANNTVPISVAKNVFFGVEAAFRGYGYYPDWREQEFSYGEEVGVATYTVVGQKLNIFDLSAANDGSGNQALGSMILHSSAVAPTA